MGIFDFLSKKKPLEYHEIYCQGCNVDITKIGGIVTTTSEAYCNRVLDGRRCIVGRIPTPATPEQFQEAIRDGHLTKYSSLEERTNEQKHLSPATRKFLTKDM